MTSAPFDPIEIDYGTHVGGIDFALSKGAVLSGTVAFPEAESREDVYVNAKYTVENGGVAIRGTGFSSSGAFHLSGLPLSASATVQLEGPGWTSDEAGPFSLASGNVTGVHLTAMRIRTATVSGRVVFGNSLPRPGETVWLSSLDGGYTRTTESGADGAFEFTLVPHGKYSASVTGSAGSTVAFDVGAGRDLKDIVIDLGGGPGTISGHVRDWKGNPVHKAQVYAPGLGAPDSEAATDASGRYALPGLADGTHTVHVQATGFGSQQRLDVSANTTGLDFELKPVGHVEGSVVDAHSGAPVGEFDVWSAYGVGEQQIESAMQEAGSGHQVNAEGVFRLLDLPPEEQAILARAHGYFTGYTIAQVPPGDSATGLVIRLEPAPIIQAQVTTAAGAPVSGAKIFINECPFTFDNPGFNKDRPLTDNSGSTPLDGLLPGENQVYVYHPEQGRGVFTVDTNRDHGTVALRLDPPARLEGVITVDGEAPPYARLRLQYPDAGHASDFRTFKTKVQSDGSYRLDGLMAGEATLHIDTGGGRQDRTVHIAAGATNTLNIDIATGTGQIELVTLLPAHLVDAQVTGTAVVDSQDGRVTLNTQADEQGLLRFESLPAGALSIHVAATLPGGTLVARTLERDITSGQRIDETVDLTAGVPVAGTVRGLDPGENAYVMLFSGAIDPALLANEGFGQLHMQMTHHQCLPASGAYRFDAVEPGIHTLVAAAEGFQSLALRTIDVGTTGTQADLLLE